MEKISEAVELVRRVFAGESLDGYLDDDENRDTLFSVSAKFNVFYIDIEIREFYFQEATFQKKIFFEIIKNCPIFSENSYQKLKKILFFDLTGLVPFTFSRTKVY